MAKEKLRTYKVKKVDDELIKASGVNASEIARAAVVKRAAEVLLNPLILNEHDQRKDRRKNDGTK